MGAVSSTRMRVGETMRSSVGFEDYPIMGLLAPLLGSSLVPTFAPQWNGRNRARLEAATWVKRRKRRDLI